MSTPSAATKDQIVKRWIVFFIGMFLMGTGIALSIKATIGVSPMSSITNLLILIFPNISLGTFSFLVNFLFLVAEFIVAPRPGTRSRSLRSWFPPSFAVCLSTSTWLW